MHSQGTAVCLASPVGLKGSAPDGWKVLESHRKVGPLPKKTLFWPLTLPLLGPICTRT